MASKIANVARKRLPRRRRLFGCPQTALAAILTIISLLSVYLVPSRPLGTSVTGPALIVSDLSRSTAAAANWPLSATPLQPVLPPRPPDPSPMSALCTPSKNDTKVGCRASPPALSSLNGLPPDPGVLSGWLPTYTIACKPLYDGDLTPTTTTSTTTPTVRPPSPRHAHPERANGSVCDPHVIKRVALACLHREPPGTLASGSIRWLKRYGHSNAELYTAARGVLLALFHAATTRAHAPAPLRK